MVLKQIHIYLYFICEIYVILSSYRQSKTDLIALEVDRIAFLSDIVPHLSDNKFTLFPLIQSTEKPDAVAASLLEGQSMRNSRRTTIWSGCSCCNS